MCLSHSTAFAPFTPAARGCAPVARSIASSPAPRTLVCEPNHGLSVSIFGAARCMSGKALDGYTPPAARQRVPRITREEILICKQPLP